MGFERALFGPSGGCLNVLSEAHKATGPLYLEGHWPFSPKLGGLLCLGQAQKGCGCFSVTDRPLAINCGREDDSLGLILGVEAFVEFNDQSLSKLFRMGGIDEALVEEASRCPPSSHSLLFPLGVQDLSSSPSSLWDRESKGVKWMGMTSFWKEWKGKPSSIR